MKSLLVLTGLLLICSTAMSLIGSGDSARFEITPQTLPVELSSFTATVTGQFQVRLLWISQSETNLQGYYVYRAQSQELSSAALVSGLIPATNSSNQQIYHFDDVEINQSGSYYYWLQSMEMDGTGCYHGPVIANVNINDDDHQAPEIALSNRLTNIFPNPFNPNVTIVYQIDNPCSVKLDIFNMRGQLVSSLQRTHSSEGQYTWNFDGIGQDGKHLSSGIYYVVMQAGNSRSVRKMVLMM